MSYQPTMGLHLPDSLRHPCDPRPCLKILEPVSGSKSIRMVTHEMSQQAHKTEHITQSLGESDPREHDSLLSECFVGFFQAWDPPWMLMTQMIWRAYNSHVLDFWSAIAFEPIILRFHAYERSTQCLGKGEECNERPKLRVYELSLLDIHWTVCESDKGT